ncbi:hypothetical protein [Luteimonas chenhongjianii]|uniref:hypothetical protein n=1 Tax=Luteimonas chenhongjianii TaxID=2006110 RepID=UPI001C9E79DA|nr:hypothetical protein [Luteimonas chenhongjianii]
MLLPAWLQMMTMAEVAPAALQGIRDTYERDVGVLPPADVAAILQAGGFARRLQVFQPGLITVGSAGHGPSLLADVTLLRGIADGAPVSPQRTARLAATFRPVQRRKGVRAPSDMNIAATSIAYALTLNAYGSESDETCGLH